VLVGLVEHNVADGAAWALLCVLVIGGLSLIGGLAAACFTKAFGSVFLGEPRSEEALRGHEVGLAMRISMVSLAAACLFVALAAPLWPRVLRASVATVAPAFFEGLSRPAVGRATVPLAFACAASWALLGIVAILALARRRLLRNRDVRQASTWDCGYAAPSSRMQYTASSFAGPLVILFRMLLRPRIELHVPQGLFPLKASFESHTPDVFYEYLYRPVFFAVAWVAMKLRWVQHGRIQLYVLYIALTILALFIWKLG
jgi:hypothetical protein